MTREPNYYQAPPPQDDDSSIIDFAGLRNDIGFVLRAPLRHPGMAAACVVFVLAAALASALVIKDSYQVTATVLAQKNQTMTLLSNPGLVRSQEWDSPTHAARESIARRENLVSVCKQAGLVEHWMATRSQLGRLRAWYREKVSGQAETQQDLLDALVDTMENKLQVNVGNEGTVTILFEWTDKETAYRVVDTLTQNFLEDRHATEVAVLEETIVILESNAKKLAQQVDTTLDDVERRQKAKPATTPRREGAGLGMARDEEVIRLQNTLVARRRALADLEESRSRRLADLNGQLAQKESIFAEQHPELVALRQSIASMSRPSASTEAMRKELVDVEREVARRGGFGSPAADADPLEARLGFDQVDVRTEYARSNLRFVREEYASVLQRLSAARMELETAQAAFKYRYSVVTPPQVPKAPKKPYFLLRLVGGLVGGLALAIFVSTMLDIRSTRLLEEWQLQRQLGVPLLARINR